MRAPTLHCVENFWLSEILTVEVLRRPLSKEPTCSSWTDLRPKFFGTEALLREVSEWFHDQSQSKESREEFQRVLIMTKFEVFASVIVSYLLIASALPRRLLKTPSVKHVAKRHVVFLQKQPLNS